MRLTRQLKLGATVFIVTLLSGANMFVTPQNRGALGGKFTRRGTA